jgi:hypothetical protein
LGLAGGVIAIVIGLVLVFVAIGLGMLNGLILGSVVGQPPAATQGEQQIAMVETVGLVVVGIVAIIVGSSC